MCVCVLSICVCIVYIWYVGIEFLSVYSRAMMGFCLCLCDGAEKTPVYVGGRNSGRRTICPLRHHIDSFHSYSVLCINFVY